MNFFLSHHSIFCFANMQLKDFNTYFSTLHFMVRQCFVIERQCGKQLRELWSWGPTVDFSVSGRRVWLRNTATHSGRAALQSKHSSVEDSCGLIFEEWQVQFLHSGENTRLLKGDVFLCFKSHHSNVLFYSICNWNIQILIILRFTLW